MRMSWMKKPISTPCRCAPSHLAPRLLLRSLSPGSGRAGTLPKATLLAVLWRLRRRAHEAARRAQGAAYLECALDLFGVFVMRRVALGHVPRAFYPPAEFVCVPPSPDSL